MKYLKEKFGNYFEFKNTINGTSYFLRGLATILFFIPIGIFIGIGLAILAEGGNTVLAGILVLLGALFLIPMLWFSIATTYKRISAFFPEKATLLTVVTLLYSFITEGFNPNNQGLDLDLADTQIPEISTGDSTIYLILIVPYLAWSFYLLFGNSKAKKHIG